MKIEHSCSHNVSLGWEKFLDKKFDFSTNLFKSQKIKIVSEEQIAFSPDEDTSVKVIALKAPIIKIQSLLSASKKLVIETDLLIIDGGYITKPKNWDIQAKKVQLLNTNPKSQWIASLIHKGGIKNANFKGASDPDCNFDIAPKPPLDDRLNDIKNEIKDIKDKFKQWLSN